MAQNTVLAVGLYTASLTYTDAASNAGNPTSKTVTVNNSWRQHAEQTASIPRRQPHVACHSRGELSSALHGIPGVKKRVCAVRGAPWLPMMMGGKGSGRRKGPNPFVCNGSKSE